MPPAARHTPRPVTQTWPPISRPAPARTGRPGGVRPGFRDLAPYEVPDGYGDDRVVALPRDPQWIYAYWEVSAGLRRSVSQRYGPKVWEEGQVTLRVYDVTDIVFDGTNAHRFWDVAVGEARAWYLHVGGAERDYCLDLGLALPDGRFVVLARSNVVRTPAEGMSPLTDAEWLTLDEIYRLSLGLDQGDSSAALVQAVAQRLKELVSSPGVSSLSSPFGEKAAPGRPFRLAVDAELVIYGSTEPGAALTLGGAPVGLQPDGTFTLRLAFPEGNLEIPVCARSAQPGLEQAVTLRFHRATTTP